MPARAAWHRQRRRNACTADDGPRCPRAFVPRVGGYTDSAQRAVDCHAATHAPPHTMPRLPNGLRGAQGRGIPCGGVRRIDGAVAELEPRVLRLQARTAASADGRRRREPLAGSARPAGGPPMEEASDAPGVCVWWLGA